jgi:hypothetical protein
MFKHIELLGGDELDFARLAAGGQLPTEDPSAEADGALLADFAVVVGHDVVGVGVDPHHAGDLHVDAGVPAKVISERLGHATIAVTMDIYSHVLPGLDREAADSVAQLILGGGNAVPEASVNTPLASGRRRGDEQDG